MYRKAFSNVLLMRTLIDVSSVLLHSKTSLFFSFFSPFMLNSVKYDKVYQHISLEHTHTNTHIYMHASSLLFLLFPFILSLISITKKKCHIDSTRLVKYSLCPHYSGRKRSRQLALSYPEVKLDEQDMENYAHDVRNC